MPDPTTDAAVCQCGHPKFNHRADDGKCSYFSCPCTAFVADVNRPDEPEMPGPHWDGSYMPPAVPDEMVRDTVKHVSIVADVNRPDADAAWETWAWAATPIIDGYPVARAAFMAGRESLSARLDALHAEKSFKILALNSRIAELEEALHRGKEANDYLHRQLSESCHRFTNENVPDTCDTCGRERVERYR